MKLFRLSMIAVMLLSVFTLGIGTAGATQTWRMIHHEDQGHNDETWDKCMPEDAWNGHKNHEGDYQGEVCTPDEDDDDGDDDVIDVCLNLDGVQEEVPEGYTQDGDNCYPEGDDGDDDETDVCLNLEGVQTEVPEGYTQDGDNCYPEGDDGDDDEQDLCPNIEGTQTEIPNGYHVNKKGNCVRERDGDDDGGTEVCDPGIGDKNVVSSSTADQYPPLIKTGPNPEDPFVCWATLCDPKTKKVFTVFGLTEWQAAIDSGATGDLSYCEVEVPGDPGTGGFDFGQLLAMVGAGGSALGLVGSYLIPRKRKES